MAIDNIQESSFQPPEAALHAIANPRGRVVELGRTDPTDLGQKEEISTREVVEDEGSTEGLAKELLGRAIIGRSIEGSDAKG